MGSCLDTDTDPTNLTSDSISMWFYIFQTVLGGFISLIYNYLVSGLQVFTTKVLVL